MKLNIIIRGHLYKENFRPAFMSKLKRKNNCREYYTQNFLEIIDKYSELFKGLMSRYKVSVTFTSYDTTPSNVIDVIQSNNWNLHLIPEQGSRQFTSCCDYIETQKDDCINLLLRSDLILKDKFISILTQFDYESCDGIFVLSNQPNNRENDILHIFPSYMNSNILQLKRSPSGHFLHRKYNISTLVKKKWWVVNKNDYYEIYRGEKL